MNTAVARRSGDPADAGRDVDTPSSGDLSIKLPVDHVEFVRREADERGMYFRRVLGAMVELWKDSGEPRRQRAIRKFSSRPRK